MNYQKTKLGSLKLIDPPRIDYVNYWGGEKSTLSEQVYNLNGFKHEGKTKCEVVYNNIQKGSVLEIGCAPGTFLRHCDERGHVAVGIAPENEVFILEHSGCIVYNGTFEQYKKKTKFDNIVALDVFEHIEDGKAFIDKAKSLLKPKGKIVLMLPILDHLDKPESMMHPEHIWLYSIEELKTFGFTKFERWYNGHSIAILQL